ncbi:hypothetical protein M0P25_03740 [archaeon]|jgi:hypothetical protein|nr:hypothetical protein [archaeon]MCK9439390.1 hypothetical protein [Patescibacteria group bacterium]
MQIINSINPNDIANINPLKNIIICVPENNKNSIKESENLSTYDIFTNKDLNLSSDGTANISPRILSLKYVVDLKISHPTGMILQFSDHVIDPYVNIYSKIYKKFDFINVCEEKTEKITHHFIQNFNFNLYIDTIRLREENLQLLIKKGTFITNFMFLWYVNNFETPQYENTYLIENNQVYEDFVNLF